MTIRKGLAATQAFEVHLEVWPAGTTEVLPFQAQNVAWEQPEACGSCWLLSTPERNTKWTDRDSKRAWEDEIMKERKRTRQILSGIGFGSSELNMLEESGRRTGSWRLCHPLLVHRPWKLGHGITHELFLQFIDILPSLTIFNRTKETWQLF